MEFINNLKNEINYSKDSIVSKTLIDKDPGSITVFAFDKGQKLSPHSAPYNAFVYIIEGKVEITIDKEVYKLEEGNSIIMPANIPHAVNAIEKFKMLLVMIKD